MCVLLSFDGKNEDKYTRKSKVFATRYVFSWDIALPSSACLGESRSLLCVGLRSIYCLLGIRNLLELQGLVMVNVFTCLKHPHLSAPVLCPLAIGLTGMPAGCSVWNRHVDAMHTEAFARIQWQKKSWHRDRPPK